MDRKRRVSRVRASFPSPSAAGRINFAPWRDNSRPRVDALTRVKISPRSTPLAETRASQPPRRPIRPRKKENAAAKKKKDNHSSIRLDTYLFFNYFIKKLNVSSIAWVLLLLRRREDLRWLSFSSFS